MERCPNCSARLSEKPNCRRCGMDLSRLFETEHAAERALIQGIRHLLAGEKKQASHAFARSLALRDTPLARELTRFLVGLDPSDRPAPVIQETAESLSGNLAFSAVQSVNGKYRNLQDTLTCPQDRAQYGEFTDYGYWSGGS